jgi:mRNA-degrading endonuclease RelE of RelBE toxin-antitoxin system
MNLKIISLGSFVKDVKKLYKKYKGIVKDLQKLENELQEDPKCGIHLGNSCYKIRLKNSSVPTGKSGGFRVIYYYVDEEKNIYLITIYSKSELENVSDEKILNILKVYDL